MCRFLLINDLNYLPLKWPIDIMCRDGSHGYRCMLLNYKYVSISPKFNFYVPKYSEMYCTGECDIKNIYLVTSHPKNKNHTIV